MSENELERKSIEYLKRKFLEWRVPVVTLPSDPVIVDVVQHIIKTVKERELDWVDINKEQPPIGMSVLTINAYGRQIVQPRYYVERNPTNGSYFLGECKRTGLVTHWMYSPTGPKKHEQS